MSLPDSLLDRATLEYKYIAFSTEVVSIFTLLSPTQSLAHNLFIFLLAWTKKFSLFFSSFPWLFLLVLFCFVFHLYFLVFINFYSI